MDDEGIKKNLIIDYMISWKGILKIKQHYKK